VFFKKQHTCTILKLIKLAKLLAVEWDKRIDASEGTRLQDFVGKEVKALDTKKR